jgi:uncharacterized membrane protein
MALAYILAGINHFIRPQFYLAIMPAWLPMHHLLVWVSGFAEITLGVLLCYRYTRRIAAWGIILLLLFVFPANIQMMLDYRSAGHPRLWLAVLRLPLQLLLIWWAYQYTKPPRQLNTQTSG